MVLHGRRQVTSNCTSNVSSLTSLGFPAHIAITSGNACVSSGRYGIFTQGCFDSAATGGNPASQTWNIVESTSPPPPPPPSGEGRTIRPTFNSNTCLGVTELANGAYLSSGSCTPTTGFYSRWDIVPGDNQVVRLSGLNWCLDAGLDFNSGSIIALKIWQCYPGVPQQRSVSCQIPFTKHRN